MHDIIRKSLATHVAVAGLVVALGAAPAMAQESEVVATVNGEPITQTDLELAEAELGAQFAQLPDEQRRAAALSSVIDIRLFASEAEEQELDQTEAFQQRMNFLRDRALHSALVDQNVVESISDEEIRERYEAEVANLTMPEEVRARHILVETEEEANEIIQQLDEGGDFASLAEEHSQDGSAAEGGDLGYFAEGQMVPAFEEVAFSLEPGTYTEEPVESQFGWHVIKVEDKRTQEPPALEQVRDQIRSLLVSEKYVEMLSSLRESAELEISDEDLAATVNQLHEQQQSRTPAPEADSQQ
ncbi:peptidylprolyl isomerase [Chelativorans sp. YIM 93263]|uniref:peptidylprolyl isomerase n=1 Tax=Chelativorans sp. YIM 93263 TaxID=2906648 RepID=UPI002377EF2D|nr:peptidylprolyl isomerase [Chelativorans sp. YIM 93263]